MKELEQYQQTEAYKIFKKQQEKKRKGMSENKIFYKIFNHFYSIYTLLLFICFVSQYIWGEGKKKILL